MFTYKGTSLLVKHFYSDYSAYIPNTIDIIKDLGIDTLRLMSAGFAKFSVVSTPTWAENLESFLALCENYGVKVTFHHLGGWTPQDPMFGIFPGEEVDLSKQKIDMLAGNNSLGHDFINDRRISLWIVANEPDLDQPSRTPGAGISDIRAWCLEICDYIRTMGARVAIGNPRVVYYNDPSRVVPIIRGHVTDYIWHWYGGEEAVRAQNAGLDVYSVIYDLYMNLWNNVLAENIPMNRVILGESGMKRNEGGTEETRGKFYKGIFQASLDTGIEGVFPFTLFDMPVPEGIELWGAVGLDGTYYPYVTNQYKNYYFATPISPWLNLLSRIVGPIGLGLYFIGRTSRRG